MKRPARQNRTPMRRASSSTVQRTRLHASSPMTLWSAIRGFFGVHATGFMATAGIVVVAGLLSFWATNAGIATFGKSSIITCIQQCDGDPACEDACSAPSCNLTFNPSSVTYNGSTTWNLTYSPTADDVQFHCTNQDGSWQVFQAFTGASGSSGTWPDRTFSQECEVQVTNSNTGTSGTCSGSYTVAPPPATVSCAAPTCPGTMGYSASGNCTQNITSGTATSHRWVVETVHGDGSTTTEYDTGYGWFNGWLTVSSPERGSCSPINPDTGERDCSGLNTGMNVSLEVAGADARYVSCGTSYIDLVGGAVCENPAIGSFNGTPSADRESITFNISGVTGTIGSTATIKHGGTTIGTIAIPSGSWSYTLPRDSSFDADKSFTATVASTCAGNPSPVDATATTTVPYENYCTGTYDESCTLTGGGTGTRSCTKVGRGDYPSTCTWGTGSSCATCAAVAVTCPTISSFSATPPSLTLGESTSLSWATTNSPDSISIDNGVGTVTGTSKSVTPATAGTKTYTLTASKAGCSPATATTTVTVNEPTITVPTLGLSCSPTTVVVGGSTTCNVTIDNPVNVRTIVLQQRKSDGSYPWMTTEIPCNNTTSCAATTNAFAAADVGTVDLMVVANGADGQAVPNQVHGHTPITVVPNAPTISNLSCSNPVDGGPLAKSSCTFSMGGNTSSVFSYELVKPDGSWLSHSVRVADQPCAGNCSIDTDPGIATPNPLQNPSETTAITNFPIVARLLAGSGCGAGANDPNCATVATTNTTITIPPAPAQPLNLTGLACQVTVAGPNSCTISVTNGATKGVKRIAIKKSQPSGGSWATALSVGDATFLGTDAATTVTINLNQDAISDVGNQLFWAGALDASGGLIASGGSIVVDIIGPVGTLSTTSGVTNCNAATRTCDAEAGKVISFAADASSGCPSTGCNHHVFHATPTCFSPSKDESANVDMNGVYYIGFTPTVAGSTCTYTVEVGYDVGSTVVLSKIEFGSTYTINVKAPATPNYGVKIEYLTLTGWGTRTVVGSVRLSNDGLATAPYYKVKLLYNAGGPTHVLYAPNCTDPNTSGCGEQFAGPVTNSPITIPLPSYTIPQSGETVTSIAVWAEAGMEPNFGTEDAAPSGWTSATFTSGGGTGVSLAPMQCGTTLYDLTQIGIQVQDPGTSVVDYIKASSVSGTTGVYTFVGQGQRNDGATSTAVHFNFAANGIVTPDAGEDHYIAFQAFNSKSTTPLVPLAEAGCHYNVISSWKYDVGVTIGGTACSQDVLRPTMLSANTLTTAMQFMCANGAGTALTNCTNPDPTGNPWDYNVFLTKAADIKNGIMVKIGTLNASGAGTAADMDVATVMADPTTVYDLRHNVRDSNGWLKQQSCYVKAQAAALDPQFTQCKSTMTFVGGGCTSAARNDATILLKASADGNEDLSTVKVILTAEPATGVTITPAGATTLTKNGATYDATWTVRLPAAAGSYTFLATIAPGSPGAGRVIKTITRDVAACTAGCVGTVGCDGVCNSGAVNDACGICGGDGSSCQQCANPVCTNGQTRCTGQTPQTCQRSTAPADCGQWVNGTVCVAPEACQNGACTNACAPADQPTATLTGTPLTIPTTGTSALTIATARSNGWTLTASSGTLSKSMGTTANDTATFTPNASGNVRIDLRATSANATCTTAVSTINITVTGNTACTDGPTATITVNTPTIQRGQTATFTVTTTGAANWTLAGRNPPGNGLAPNQGTGNATTTQVTYTGTTAGTDTVTLTAVKASTNPACANAVASASITVDPGPTSVCGDSQVSGTEQCDDGNATSGDGCSNSCTLEPPLLVACPSTFITPTGFRGTWTNNVGVAGYKLDLLQGATISQTATEPKTASFHDWTGLTPSTDYIFRVASTGANNSVSAFAQVLCRTTGTNAPGIALTVDTPTLPADGTSTAILTATLVNFTAAQGKTISFTRTDGTGTLVQTTAVSDAEGKASVTLRAPDATTTVFFGTFQASVPSDGAVLTSNTKRVVYIPEQGFNDLVLSLSVPLEGRLPTTGGLHGTYKTTTLEVTLSGPGIATPIVRSNVSTNDAGIVELTFAGLDATAGSKYTVSLKDAQHLRRTVQVVALTGNAMVLDLSQPSTYTELPANNPMKGKGFLPAGDIESSGTNALHDNVANTFDIGAWLSAFRKQDITSLIADEDGNGAVGAEDLSLIIRNYNSTGDATS